MLVIMILFLSIVLVFVGYSINVKNPIFTESRVFIVSGSDSIYEVMLNQYPLKDGRVLKLDIAMHLMSIASGNGELFVSGFGTDSKTVSGVYRVDPLTGATALVYDSWSYGIGV